MSTGNPLEQIRRRMQSHATPTAFAALAEDHRRAGRLAEAVAVCRDGLERYPAYVSGRVTLGRALLDSGDAVGAVAELEHAVAQAPDNLAAARALETARAALGHAPRPDATAVAAVADLPLRTPSGDTLSMPPPLSVRAFDAGPLGPEEFGPAAGPILKHDFQTEVFLPHTGPADDPAIAPSQAGTPVVERAESDPSGDGESVSFWMEPFGGEAVFEAAPFADWGEEPSPTVADASPSPWAGEDTTDTSPAWTTPDGPSAAWALGNREADGADPTPFQGTRDVEESRPRPFAGITGNSGWADAAAATSTASLTEFSPETLPSAPTACWGRMDDEAATDGGVTLSHEAPGSWLAASTDSALEPVQEATWEDVQGAPWEETSESRLVDTSDEVAMPLLTDMPAEAADTVPASTAAVPAAVAWSGSVRSALGEVFALAGHGESLEPPAHPSSAVCDAMADTAVDAARDDAASRDNVPPIRASLEEMLAVVRARRAALSGSLDS